MMQQNSVEAIPVLVHQLQNIDERYEDEKLAFSEATRAILAASGNVSRKSILFYFVSELENTTDVVRIDVLRNCLELLLGLSKTVE